MLPRVLLWLAAVVLFARSRAAVGRSTRNPVAPRDAGAAKRPCEHGRLRPARGVRSLRGGFPLAVLGLLLAACAPVLSAAPIASAQADTVSAPVPAASPDPPAAAPAPGLDVQIGNASWYGPKFAGRLTSDGEVFDPNKLTAAHRTLPFGTLVKVTNLVNGMSVVVRINDRGPFKPNRIIDLSRAAAAAIGMETMGVAKVRLEPLSLPDGVVRLGVGEQLHGFQVVSRFHRVGQLLVLSRRDGADPVVVRVVGTDVPPESGADVLVPADLYQRLGTQAHVQDR